MSAVKRVACVLAWVVALGMMATPASGADRPSIAQQKIFDVKLRQGFLLGQVVTAAGKADAERKVTLLSKSSKLALVKTDERGRFKLPVPKSGSYRLVVGDQRILVRVWGAEIAPPQAKDNLLCVTRETVRGQASAAAAGGAVGAAGVATAVAASVAIPTVVGGVVDIGIIDFEEDNEPAGAGEPAS